VPGAVGLLEIDDDAGRPLPAGRQGDAVAVDADGQGQLAGDLKLVPERAVVVLAVEQDVPLRSEPQVAGLALVRLAVDGGRPHRQDLGAILTLGVGAGVGHIGVDVQVEQVGVVDLGAVGDPVQLVEQLRKRLRDPGLVAEGHGAVGRAVQAGRDLVAQRGRHDDVLADQVAGRFAELAALLVGRPTEIDDAAVAEPGGAWGLQHGDLPTDPLERARTWYRESRLCGW